MATRPLTEDEWLLKRLSAQSVRLLRKKAALRARLLAAEQANHQNEAELVDIEAQQRSLVDRMSGEHFVNRPLAGLAGAPPESVEQVRQARAERIEQLQAEQIRLDGQFAEMAERNAPAEEVGPVIRRQGEVEADLRALVSAESAPVDTPKTTG